MDHSYQKISINIREVNFSDLPFTPFPSPSNNLAMITTEVFASGSDNTSPTIVGFEVDPWTNTYDNSKEPVSTVAVQIPMVSGRHMIKRKAIHLLWKR